ncbi:MAG: 3-phosphoshikimate 1-carboxyvinyltransferase [Ruminococcaceae bacterium]|nr:3-phosphoshikimate 1-carboxyvinyltransferase [Oscillospiraceae bacterium]
MTVRIEKSRAVGTVSAPPSKSAAHRALICGALGSGSVIKGISDSRDMEATLSALRSLGAFVEKTGDTVRIGGLDPKKIKKCSAFCGESGSTLRFLIPLCLLSGEEIKLTGSEKLMSRPLTEYEKLCGELGFSFTKEKNSVTLKGVLKSGDYVLSLGESSQFMTGLLFALSTLDGESTVKIEGKAESLSYVALTVEILKDFGIEITENDGVYVISGGTFKAQSYTVEGDFSNAAFLDGLNYLGYEVSVTGLSENTLQGDSVYPLLFEKVKKKEEVDLTDCPDLAPVLFALAAYFGGGSFTGTARLRLKESDRISAMKSELEKFGVSLAADENTVVVGSEGLSAPKEKIYGHNDHRIVMANALLLTLFGGEIEGAEAVSKSFPDFFDVIKKLGIEVKEVDA